MEPSTREQRIIERQTGYDPVIAPWVWMLEDSRRRTKEAMQGISGWGFTSYGWIWRTQMLKALRTMTPAEFRRVRTGGDYAMTPEWALYHLMQQEAEHRGQIMELRQRAEKVLLQQA